jgi:hypothetical protein
LWGIALPGFGQLLNGKYVKGIFFIILELLINVQARLNTSIIHSFQGNMTKAVQVTDYQWLLFYPCVYIFAMWDGYNDALKQVGRSNQEFISIPFVVAAYITTIGTIYSDKPIGSLILGPVFQPILSMIFGFIIGFIVKKILLYNLHRKA